MVPACPYLGANGWVASHAKHVWQLTRNLPPPEALIVPQLSRDTRVGLLGIGDVVMCGGVREEL